MIAGLAPRFATLLVSRHIIRIMPRRRSGASTGGAASSVPGLRSRAGSLQRPSGSSLGRTAGLAAVVFLAWSAFVLFHWISLHVPPAIVNDPRLYWERWVKAWNGWGSFVPALGRYGVALASALLLLFACRCLGSRIRTFLVPNTRQPELVPAGIVKLSDLAAGIAILGTGSLGLGLLGLVRGIVGVLILSIGAAHFYFMLNASRSRSSLRLPAFPSVTKVIVIPILGLVFLDVVAALGPEFFYDSLICHLAAPEQFLRQGRVTWIDTMHPAASPMAPQLAAMWLQGIAGESAVRLLDLSLILLAGLAVAGFARSLAKEKPIAGWLGFGLWVSLPVMAWETEISFTDGAWALCSGLGLYWAIFVRNGSGMAMWLAFSGCSGKYPALAHTAILIAIIAFRLRPASRFLREFMLSCSVVALPWLARNWLWTGDPVYPHLTGLGLGHGFSDEGLQMLHHEWRSYGLGLSALLPWDLTMNDFTDRYWSETLGPLPLMLVPLLFLFRAGHRETRRSAVALVCVVWLALWCVTGQVSRYLLPALVPGIGLLVSEALSTSGVVLVVTRLALVTWIVCAPLYRIQHRLFRSLTIEGEHVVTGHVSLQEFRSAHGIGRMNPWLIVHSSPSSRVLLVQDEATYGLVRPALASHLYDVPILDRTARDVDSLQRLRIRLRQRGITYLILNEEQSERYASIPSRLSRLGPRSVNLLSEFRIWLGEPSHREGMISVWRLPFSPHSPSPSSIPDLPARSSRAGRRDSS